MCRRSSTLTAQRCKCTTKRVTLSRVNDPSFINSGAVMHADIINSRNECRRRILATEVEVQRVAGLDLLIDYLAGNANPPTGLRIVDPQFDIRHAECCRCKVLETALHTILADAGAGVEPNRHVWVL